ncbi:MAG: hypothetical protein Q7W02_16465 [Candidatus Rokubacteria bacterium]|nr:hypothetical protein [Candidatus Rokubacteria bacterium]
MRLDRWYFGRFGIILFLLSWQRAAKVRWFRKTYREEMQDREVKASSDQLPSIVAHSFGSYILGNALLKYDFVRFDKVILCGSILSSDFPWPEIIARGQVQAVRNEYGTRDRWARLVKWFVRGTGPSGISGFRAHHTRLIQEEFHYTHSEYFDKSHMEDRWKPFLEQTFPQTPRVQRHIPFPRANTPWALYTGYLAILTLGLLALFTAWLHQPSIPSKGTSTPESHTDLSVEEARLAIDAMVKEFPGMSSLRVLSITSPVNGISAVAINPPYREFPNVVLFRFDEGAKRWKRVFEALSLGIQPEVSKRLDLHTLGEAFDIEQTTSAEERDFTSAFSAGQGWVSIAYKRFVHFHPSGRETYYIDKREFSRLAEALFATRRYKDDTCILFDVPDLLEVSLSHDLGRFKLTARTLNDQQWTVTFTGIDGRGHLDQKYILAESTDKRASRSGVRSPGAVSAAVSDARMWEKIHDAASKLDAHAPLARIGFFDIAYPSSAEEYGALGGFGVMLITVLSQDEGELPVKRVYFRLSGKSIELPLISSRKSELSPEHVDVSRVLGKYRADALYAFPMNLRVSNGDLVIDFSRGRQGFVLAHFPVLLEGKDLPVSAPSQKQPSKGALLTIIKREFPMFVESERKP